SPDGRAGESSPGQNLPKRRSGRIGGVKSKPDGKVDRPVSSEAGSRRQTSDVGMRIISPLDRSITVKGVEFQVGPRCKKEGAVGSNNGSRFALGVIRPDNGLPLF